MNEFGDFDSRLASLEASLDAAGVATAAFDAELRRMGQSMTSSSREVESLSRSLGGGLRRAFDGMMFDGLKLSDALRQVSRSMLDAVYSVAMRPLQNAVGSTLAQGLQGGLASVLPFAEGGVVSGPVLFPMRGGRAGLIGEAGPEAILPLARGPDGRLGVRASDGAAGRAVSVVINVSTPDVAGFRRSEGQIAAELGRLLARGHRNQ